MKTQGQEIQLIDYRQKNASNAFNRTRDIKGIICAFFAIKDIFVSQSDNEQIEAEFNKHSINLSTFAANSESFAINHDNKVHSLISI
jgi:hypothetical protein